MRRISRTSKVAASAAALVFTLAACGELGASAPNIQGDVVDAGNDSHKVVYQVGGSANKVDVTYSNDGMGGSSQQNGVDTPWRKKMTLPSSGFDTYTLMPQNMGESGTVTCKITVDGKVMARQSSSGGYAMTTCTASLGM